MTRTTLSTTLGSGSLVTGEVNSVYTDAIRQCATAFGSMADALGDRNHQLEYNRTVRGAYYGHQDPGKQFAANVVPACDATAEQTQALIGSVADLQTYLVAAAGAWDATDTHNSDSLNRITGGVA